MHSADMEYWLGNVVEEKVFGLSMVASIES